MYIFVMHVLVVCKPVLGGKCMCVCVCKCWCESVCARCNWIALLYLNTMHVYVKMCMPTDVILCFFVL